MDRRKVVGATGFEPATPCAQGRCATRLRYAPTLKIFNFMRFQVSPVPTAQLRRAASVIAPFVCWHRKLPASDAKPMGEHTIEATSRRVPDTLADRDELWNRCQDELIVTTATGTM